MNEIKALILCNNPLAVPGLREFLFYGKIAAVAIPKRNKEMQHILIPLLEENNVPLVLVSKKDFEAELFEAIEQYQPNVGIMMTFPYLLSTRLLQLIPKGFINFHYGLLPWCRGPQPILQHMLNNDTHAGVTVHVVEESVDTGGIICQEKIPIEETDTYGILQGKLAYLGAKQAANLLKILSYGSIIPTIKQDESKAVYYNMPTATELTINWNEMSAAQIIRLVNACNPWNKGAGTSIKGWVLGITAAELAGDCPEDDQPPGTILSCNNKDGLLVKTIDNKKLKITILYTNEGYFTGEKMASFGLETGENFS